MLPESDELSEGESPMADEQPSLAEQAKPGTRELAAALTRELGVRILWCPLGFEIPLGGGMIEHTWEPARVREMLPW